MFQCREVFGKEYFAMKTGAVLRRFSAARGCLPIKSDISAWRAAASVVKVRFFNQMLNSVHF
jgi:hypothetical protein